MRSEKDVLKNINKTQLVQSSQCKTEKGEVEVGWVQCQNEDDRRLNLVKEGC